MFNPPSLYPLFGESHPILFGSMVVLILIAVPIWLALIVFIVRTERRDGYVAPNHDPGDRDPAAGR